MDTKLDLRAFNANSQTGLLFSIFDSLKAGELFKVICESDPEYLKKEFQKADLNLKTWKTSRLADGSWEILIGKQDENDTHKNGCCGVCGGHN